MIREETEICPYCDKLNIFQLDVERDGYKVRCEHCGKELMLCDACFNSKDNRVERCDWSEVNGCWRNRK